MIRAAGSVELVELVELPFEEFGDRPTGDVLGALFESIRVNDELRALLELHRP